MRIRHVHRKLFGAACRYSFFPSLSNLHQISKQMVNICKWVSYLWRFLIHLLNRSGRIHQSKLSRGPLQTPTILSTRLAGTVHASTGVQKEKWAHPFCGVSSKSTGCGLTPCKPVFCDCKLAPSGSSCRLGKILLQVFNLLRHMTLSNLPWNVG